MLRQSLSQRAPAAKFSIPGARKRPPTLTGAATGSTGATPRRSSVHATSNFKKGKHRFDLQDAIRRDRDRIERNKTLPWRERLEDLKVYPWKFFVVFMVLWTWLGTYVVPYMKGDMASSLPPDVRAMQGGKLT